MLGEYFQVRRLIWDDICPHIRPSEANELRWAIGNRLIDENQELKAELGVLVEILSEYQQQSDGIREALVERRDQRVPEPPGRALLLEKLKLLATDLRARNADHRVLQSPKDHELLQYVLSAQDDSGEQEAEDQPPPLTPRMADVQWHKELLCLSPREAVLLRPGTGSGKRPMTATSSHGRPVSRGSTLSNTSTTSSIVESPELRQRLNVDEIDSIKDAVQEGLVEEGQLLLEDIEFLQSCIEMEQELLDDDRRQIGSARPPPSLQDLQDLRRVLEKTLEDQDNVERVEAIMSKTVVARRVAKPLHVAATTLGSLPTLPQPPPRETQHQHSQSLYHSYLNHEDDQSVSHYNQPRRGSGSTSNTSNSCTRVLKIRHTIQEARDEPFLS